MIVMQHFICGEETNIKFITMEMVKILNERQMKIKEKYIRFPIVLFCVYFRENAALLFVKVCFWEMCVNSIKMKYECVFQPIFW